MYLTVHTLVITFLLSSSRPVDFCLLRNISSLSSSIDPGTIPETFPYNNKQPLKLSAMVRVVFINHLEPFLDRNDSLFWLKWGKEAKNMQKPDA